MDTSADAEPAAPTWPEVPPEARQRVLSATLQALEPLGHTPALDAHLAQATPAVLRDVARTLHVLGLHSYSMVDWAALVAEQPDASAAPEATSAVSEATSGAGAWPAGADSMHSTEQHSTQHEERAW